MHRPNLIPNCSEFGSAPNRFSSEFVVARSRRTGSLPLLERLV